MFTLRLWGTIWPGYLFVNSVTNMSMSVMLRNICSDPKRVEMMHGRPFVHCVVVRSRLLWHVYKPLPPVTALNCNSKQKTPTTVTCRVTYTVTGSMNNWLFPQTDKVDYLFSTEEKNKKLSGNCGMSQNQNLYIWNMAKLLKDVY